MRRLTGEAVRAFRRSVAKALGRPTSTVQFYGARGPDEWNDRWVRHAYSLRVGAVEMQRSGSGMRPREFVEFMRDYSADYWRARWRFATVELAGIEARNVGVVPADETKGND